MPCEEVKGVAVVATLGRVLGAIKIVMKIYLFAGVVFVYVLTLALDLVDAIFDAVDAAAKGVLGDADAVA